MLSDDVIIYITKSNGAQIKSGKPVSFLFKFGNPVNFLTTSESVRTGQGINRNIKRRKGAKVTQNTYLTHVSFVLRKLAKFKVM